MQKGNYSMRLRIVQGSAAAILVALSLSPPTTAAEINDEQCAVMREAARAALVLNKTVLEEGARLLANNLHILAVRATMSVSDNKPMTKELDTLLEIHNSIAAVGDALSAAKTASIPPTKALVSLVVTVCPLKP